MESQAHLFASMSLTDVFLDVFSITVFCGRAGTLPCRGFQSSTRGGTCSPDDPVMPVLLRSFHVLWPSHCYTLDASPPATRIPSQETSARFFHSRLQQHNEVRPML